MEVQHGAHPSRSFGVPNAFENRPIVNFFDGCYHAHIIPIRQ